MVSTQTPPQNSSPRPMHSPPLVICVVPVPLSSPVDPPVDVPSLSDELEPLSDPDVLSDPEVLSELEVASLVDVVSGVEVVSVVSGSVDDVGLVAVVDVGPVDDVDTPLVLDIESVPVIDSLIDSPVLASVSPMSSPLQATRARPTSADMTTDAGPCTQQIDTEQKGQRLSLSQT